jgi:hypothetical protein
MQVISNCRHRFKEQLIDSRICDKLHIATNIPQSKRMTTANASDLRIAGEASVDIDIDKCSYVQKSAQQWIYQSI